MELLNGTGFFKAPKLLLEVHVDPGHEIQVQGKGQHPQTLHPKPQSPKS